MSSSSQKSYKYHHNMVMYLYTVHLYAQVFDNSTDTCTTNFSISGQLVPCSEAYASSHGLLHFVFQQVGRERWLLWCDHFAGGGLPEYCQCQFQLEYWSERQGNQTENRMLKIRRLDLLLLCRSGSALATWAPWWSLPCFVHLFDMLGPHGPRFLLISIDQNLSLS